MELAIIETGGKQYLIKPGQKIKIDPIKNLRKEIAPAKEIIFDKVLLAKEDSNVFIGKPYLENIKVKAKFIKEGKGGKIIVFKYKPKKRYKVKKGHRQLFWEVEILNIQK